MKMKQLSILSLICLVVTILWLVSLIASMVDAGTMETYEQVLAHVSKVNILFYLTYTNAALITMAAVMLFAGLYLHYKSIAPIWAFLGIIFVPIYGTMNLLVYLSQITVVPRLLKLQTIPEYNILARFLLQQVIQQWHDSAVWVINNLAYAVLGVPSIVFGLLMFQSIPVLRLGGILLSLSGLASLVGFIGIVAQNEWISNGSLIGGILFLLALVCMSCGFSREKSFNRLTNN